MFENKKKFEELQQAIFNSLMSYGYQLKEADDKTLELLQTISTLATQKAELEDKVKELTDVIAKLKACCPPSEEGKQVLHG